MIRKQFIREAFTNGFFLAYHHFVILCVHHQYPQFSQEISTLLGQRKIFCPRILHLLLRHLTKQNIMFVVSIVCAHPGTDLWASMQRQIKSHLSNDIHTHECGGTLKAPEKLHVTLIVCLSLKKKFTFFCCTSILLFFFVFN